VTHGVQLSGVSVTLESVVFEGNTAACVGAECGDYYGPVFGNGGGASIMIEAPIVNYTSITIHHCELFSNAAALPAGIDRDDGVWCSCLLPRYMFLL
jgi:hypothetical protein